MAVALVDAQSNAGTDTSSISVTKPTGLADTHVLVALVAARANNTINTPTGGATWVLVPNCDQGNTSAGTGTAQGKLFYKVVTSAAGEPSSYGFSTSGSNRWSVTVAAFSGVDNTTPFDGTASQSNGSAATCVCPSVSPSDATGYLTFWGADRDGSAPTGVSAGALQHENHAAAVSSALATQQLASSGATGTRSFTGYAGSDDSRGFSAVLAPAAAPSSFTGWGVPV